MMKRMALGLTIAIAFSGLGGPAEAQNAPPKRPFDLVTGIVFTCASATGFAWTGAACGKLAADFKKRAEALKLPFVEVLITADFSRKKRDTVNGFNEDKAVRVFWNFTASGPKGGVRAALAANRIWEPTPQEVRNVAPGQRIAMNFYTQSVLLDPGATGAQAEPYLKQITDNFFKVGEGRT